MYVNDATGEEMLVSALLLPTQVFSQMGCQIWTSLCTVKLEPYLQTLLEILDVLWGSMFPDSLPQSNKGGALSPV